MSLFLRLRRLASVSSSILHRHSLTINTIQNPNPNFTILVSLSRTFKTTTTLLSTFRNNSNNNSFNNRGNNSGFDGDDIGPDTILFEGCDYNHWLITMDFPKGDNAPTREDKIETYLQTLAKVVGSYEEAKKKMYACSTTTYEGFQCLVSEEESEKFKGLPGVVFVLPDSYIDPINKEYGGDKYDNGVITPRPPPMQYGRQGGRYSDRNRLIDRNRPNDQGSRGYENRGPWPADNRNFGQQQNPSVPYNQGNPGYDNQGPRHVDNRNFGQQNNPQVPRQQTNPAFANRGSQVPNQQANPAFANRGAQVPNQQANPAFANRGAQVPNQQANPAFANRGSQVPNQQANPAFANKGPVYGDDRNFGRVQNPSVQPNYGSIGGEGRDPSPINSTPGPNVPPYHGSNYNQNQQGYYNPQGERVPSQQSGYPRDDMNYAPPQRVAQGQRAGEPFGQMGGGNIQGSGGGDYGQTPGGNYGQGAGGNNSQGFNFQQTYPGHGEGMSPMEQRDNVYGEQRNYGQAGRA